MKNLPLLSKICAISFVFIGILAFSRHSEAKDITFSLPENAKQVSENVYSLGKKVDPVTHKLVEGYAIVDRGRSGNARPDHAGGPKSGGGTSTCYTTLAKGAYWKTVEPWVMNTSNNDNLDGTTVFNIMSNAIQKWEDTVNVNILGQGSTTTNALTAETSGAPDGVNEVYFADITDSSTIGVTIVWGQFYGPPSSRELVEWDQVYDDVTYNWSAEANGVAGKMDFDNIATHELGHSVGLGDLYDGACSAETMYGYAGTGETNKRDLNDGDIQGMRSLY